VGKLLPSSDSEVGPEEVAEAFAPNAKHKTRMIDGDPTQTGEMLPCGSIEECQDIEIRYTVVHACHSYVAQIGGEEFLKVV